MACSNCEGRLGSHKRERKAVWRARHLLAVGLASVLLFGCAPSQEIVTVVEEPQFESFGPSLTKNLVDAADEFGTASVNACFASGFNAYVQSRIVEIEPTQREPQSFGPWFAHKDYFATDAHDDGSLTEWYDEYFISHEWSETGKQILTFIPGDTVEVNGLRVQIASIYNYPKDSYYDEITAVTGDNVVFQTCYPNSDYNRICFGPKV